MREKLSNPSSWTVVICERDHQQHFHSECIEHLNNTALSHQLKTCRGSNKVRRWGVDTIR